MYRAQHHGMVSPYKPDIHGYPQDYMHGPYSLPAGERVYPQQSPVQGGQPIGKLSPIKHEDLFLEEESTKNYSNLSVNAVYQKPRESPLCDHPLASRPPDSPYLMPQFQIKRPNHDEVR